MPKVLVPGEYGSNVQSNLKKVSLDNNWHMNIKQSYQKPFSFIFMLLFYKMNMKMQTKNATLMSVYWDVWTV